MAVRFESVLCIVYTLKSERSVKFRAQLIVIPRLALCCYLFVNGVILGLTQWQGSPFQPLCLECPLPP